MTETSEQELEGAGRCGICGRPLDDGTGGSLDCGGDCWACVGQIEAEEGHGLPDIEGGWDLQPIGAVRVWVPRAPDALLEDEGVQERNRVNDSMPYWAWLWESAPRMTETLVGRGLSGRVLEVGSGLGLVGLGVAAAADSVELTLSDNDPLAMAALRVNAQVNRLTDVRVWELDWRALDSVPDERFDVIVGCDVIYESQAHDALLNLFERFLDRTGGAIYLADPGRSRVPEFVRRAEARSWKVSLEDVDGRSASPRLGEYRLLVLRR